jgi:hypothetical protein
LEPTVEPTGFKPVVVQFIESANNSLYLDANPRTQGNGAQVYLWEFNGGRPQRWRIREAK